MEYPNIHEALACVNREIDAIGKNAKNKQQGFMYRGIDDAYNTLHDLLAKYGVITIPRVLSRDQVERTSAKGAALFYTTMFVEYDFIAEDGSKITVGPVVGEAMDSGDKGSNKCLAIAHKYALFQTFTIPTLFSDPDAETHEVKAEDPLATEEQKQRLKDLWDYAGKRHQSWMRKNIDRMTVKHAESIIADAEAAYARDAAPGPQDDQQPAKGDE